LNLLAFDYGSKRIGVAVGNSLTGAAQPLEPLNGRDVAGLPAVIKRLLGDWQPARLIVGLPLDMEGKTTTSTEAARAFAKVLREQSDLPVELHDERLTTREAEAVFRNARQGGQARRKHAAKLDSVAAALILESWLRENT
jgi:putative holliday junction resolvase